MSALTQGRNTPRRDGDRFVFPVAEGAVCFVGGIAIMEGGFCLPGYETDPAAETVGVFEETVDNSDGGDGDATVKVRRGVFRFANGVGLDEISLNHVGKAAFVIDDQTVGLGVGASNGRTLAGKVVDVDAQGVWVEMDAYAEYGGPS